ncbi:MAG: hypothetical protein R3E97_25000 [Candidatus Eisenbacteria bacterium]
MLVDDEVISHFVQQAFLDPDDDRVLEQLLSQPLGSTGLAVGNFISKDDLRAKLRQQLVAMDEEPEPHPGVAAAPAPSRPRSTGRKGRLGGGSDPPGPEPRRAGRDVARALPGSAEGRPTSPSSRRCRSARSTMPSGSRRSSRRKPKAKELEEVFSQLDALGDQVRERIRAALEGK